MCGWGLFAGKGSLSRHIQDICNLRSQGTWTNRESLPDTYIQGRSSWVSSQQEFCTVYTKFKESLCLDGGIMGSEKGLCPPFLKKKVTRESHHPPHPPCTLRMEKMNICSCEDCPGVSCPSLPSCAWPFCSGTRSSPVSQIGSGRWRFLYAWVGIGTCWRRILSPVLGAGCWWKLCASSYCWATGWKMCLQGRRATIGQWKKTFGPSRWLFILGWATINVRVLALKSYMGGLGAQLIITKH